MEIKHRSLASVKGAANRAKRALGLDEFEDRELDSLKRGPVEGIVEIAETCRPG